MGKNSKYFLSIDDNIIDFSSNEAFRGLRMEDFLSISLFTTLFQDEMDLIKTLQKLGINLPSEVACDKIEIVKRTGTKKDGYNYSFASDDILYKSGIDKLSTRAISNFLISIRGRYDIISELLDTYEIDLKRLEKIFKYKIEQISTDLGYANEPSDIASLKEQLAAKNGSLKNIVSELAIIDKIKSKITTFIDPNCTFNRDEALQYMQLLSMFVKAETIYRVNDRLCVNAKGLFRFAARIDSILKAHQELEFSSSTIVYTKERQELLRALRNALQNKSQITSIYFELEQEEEPKIETSKVVSSQSALTDEDPDDFMLLENEDFTRLLEGSSSNEAKESLETALLELEEKKGKHL